MPEKILRRGNMKEGLHRLLVNFRVGLSHPLNNNRSVHHCVEATMFHAQPISTLPAR